MLRPGCVAEVHGPLAGRARRGGPAGLALWSGMMVLWTLKRIQSGIGTSRSLTSSLESRA